MANYSIIKEKLKELDEEIRTRYPNSILDGIIDWENESYELFEPKILWILKEANMKGPDDLSDYLCNYIKTKDSSFRATWKFVLEITNAIIKNAQDWENEVTVGNVLLEEGLLKKIAVINIKKSGGGGRSDMSVINDFYDQDKDIIHRQIQYLAPNIIINASGVDVLFDTLKKGECYNVGVFKVAKQENGIILNVYHPNFRKIKKEDEMLYGENAQKYYFELIRDCIKVIT